MNKWTDIDKEFAKLDVYPRTSITRGANYQKRMRFL